MTRPALSSPAAAQGTMRPSVLKTAMRFLRSLPAAGQLGLAIVSAWLLVALFGPVFAPYDIGRVVADDVFAGFSAKHPLGSDYLGRDVMSRLFYGVRYTVGLAFAGALLASATGTIFALVAAVTGRWVDEILSRFMDALVSIPSKILALVIVAAFGSSIPLLLLVAAVTYVSGAYRIARSMAVNINAMDYVQVARARGEGGYYIACAEILPNMINPMLADFGVRFVFVVLLLSGLSFLGLGVQPPNADLGSLVRENISGLWEAAPAIMMPALAIATLTIGVNLAIDSLPGSSRRFAGKP
ncbi:MAG: ABC transporter permease [Alphaproteobacteria bacterium]|nr:MAG: ABC transporter permease [Alphaproteobacteria bacterium]